MHRVTFLAAAAALAAAPALSTLAQQEPAAGRAGQQPAEARRGAPAQLGARPGQAEGPQAMNDQLFAMAAAEAGLAEIGISQLALQKTQDEQVRQFAETMIQDHTQANQQLAQLAQAKGIELPRGPGLKDTATAMALSVCPPDTFPADFFQQQVAAHITAVGLFKAEAEHGQDPELRQLAQTLLPKLEQHLQMAQQHGGGHSAATDHAPADPAATPAGLDAPDSPNR